MRKKRLLQMVGAASGAILLTTVLKKRSTASGAAPKVGASSEAGQEKVWVNTERGIYHRAGTRWYGKTANGDYMTEKAARAAGFTAASSAVRPTGKRVAARTATSRAS